MIQESSQIPTNEASDLSECEGGSSSIFSPLMPQPLLVKKCCTICAGPCFVLHSQDFFQVLPQDALSGIKGGGVASVPLGSAVVPCYLLVFLLASEVDSSSLGHGRDVGAHTSQAACEGCCLGRLLGPRSTASLSGQLQKVTSYVDVPLGFGCAAASCVRAPRGALAAPPSACARIRTAARPGGSACAQPRGLRGARAPGRRRCGSR